MADDEMTEDDWKGHARHVVAAMRGHTEPFVTPISYEKPVTAEEPDNVPRLSGTGSFISLFNRRFLLTNEHVLGDGQQNAWFPNLAHGLPGSNDKHGITRTPLFAPFPIDCAINLVADDVWATNHHAQTISDAQFTWAHAPVAREILFFRGYAQEHSSFHFETLIDRSMSYATQEMADLPAGLNERYFFALHHSPEHAEMLDGSGHLPLPPGFSGSTVWDTRYLACLAANKPWTPAEARVTGVVCRWRSGDTGIVVLRVEHLRSWLLNAFNGMSRP
jgi:hypothetical protein